MMEALKSAILAGLGAVALTQERLQATVDELIQRGRITREQVKTLVEELLRKGQEEGRVVADRIARGVSGLVEKGPLVTRKEHQDLVRRVEDLEGRLGLRAPPATDPATSGAGASPGMPEGPGASDLPPDS